MTRRIGPILSIPLVVLVISWAAWRAPVDGSSSSPAWSAVAPADSADCGECAVDQSACLLTARCSGVISTVFEPGQMGDRAPAADPANAGARPLSFLSGSLRISRPPPS